MNGYFSATRHSWSSLLFITPLLIIYEAGVIALNRSNPDTWRNGADVWLRNTLASYGVTIMWAAPLIIFAGLLIFAFWNHSTRPKDMFGTIFGMAIESVIYAAGIWALSRNFRQLLDQTGVMSMNSPFQSVPMGQVVNFLGAGIYEEVLFRFILFSVLFYILRIVLFPAILTMIIAGILSALMFSGAHHLAGEEFVPVVFVFRTVVGLIFTVIFVTRGLGIAVGAHAGYNILVGPAVG